MQEVNKIKYIPCSFFNVFPPRLGVSLKKKQMWTLEPAEKDLIAFKSHLDKYISVDQVNVFINVLLVTALSNMV